jgi:hypothetical protein
MFEETGNVEVVTRVTRFTAVAVDHMVGDTDGLIASNMEIAQGDPFTATVKAAKKTETISFKVTTSISKRRR